jgi:hypothetical protein
MAVESRIQIARRRVRIARYSIGAVATGAFAVLGLAARDAHPATQTRPAVAASSLTTAQEQDDTFSFGGGGSIGPSASGAPTVQSSGS